MSRSETFKEKEMLKISSISEECYDYGKKNFGYISLYFQRWSFFEHVNDLGWSY